MIIRQQFRISPKRQRLSTWKMVLDKVRNQNWNSIPIPIGIPEIVRSDFEPLY